MLKRRIYYIIIINLLLFFISCVSDQERWKSNAFNNALQNVCPNFGMLNGNDPLVRKSFYSEEQYMSNGRQKYDVLYVVVTTPSGSKKAYLASHALQAKELKTLDEIQIFKEEFFEVCPNSEVSKEITQNELDLLRKEVKNCVTSKNKCLEQIPFKSNTHKFQIVYPLIDQATQYENKEILVNFLLKSELDKESTFDLLEKMAVASDSNKSIKRSAFLDYCKRADDVDHIRFQSSDISKKYYQEIEKENRNKELANSCPQNSKFNEALQLCIGGVTTHKSSECPTKKKDGTWSGLCSNDYEICFCAESNLQNSINYCKKSDMRLPNASEMERILQYQDLKLSGLFWTFPKSKHPFSGKLGYMAIGKMKQLMYIEIEEGNTTPFILCVK